MALCGEVGLSAAIVSGYLCNENMQLTEFKNHYTQYQKQLRWHEKFFNYMVDTQPTLASLFVWLYKPNFRVFLPKRVNGGA